MEITTIGMSVLGGGHGPGPPKNAFPICRSGLWTPATPPVAVPCKFQRGSLKDAALLLSSP